MPRKRGDREVWLTDTAKRALAEIQAATPVPTRPSQVVEAALTDFAKRTRRKP